MNKKYLVFVFCLILMGAFLVSGCAQSAQTPIVIGVNAPLTGDIPKVGEGSKFSAEMWLEDIEAAGGLEVANGPAPATQAASRGAKNIHQNLRIVYLASVFYFLTRAIRIV